MMKRQLLALYLLFIAVAIEANPVTAEQARQKAVQFLQGQVKAGARRRAPSAKQMRMAAKGRADTYYIFNAATPGDGYVVVSGDDATDPILGYSHTGTIDPDNMPCGMRMLLDSYTDQINFLRDHSITREQNKSARKAPARSSYIIEKRIANYGQDSPYYDLCPEGNAMFPHAKTGCIATAMVELMYYHMWPRKLSNTIHGYVTNNSRKYIINEIPSDTSIDWISILPDYYWIDDLGFSHQAWNEDIQATAVAELMLMAGASVQMKYDLVASEAYGESIPYALKQYFGYDNDVIVKEREYYSNDEWYGLLYKEIEDNGPVLYCGYSGGNRTGGHAFVLEGYDNSERFYVNFGADAEYNGFYSLNVVYGQFQYIYNQLALFNVKPKDNINSVDIPLTLWCEEFYAIDNCCFAFNDVSLFLKMRNFMPRTANYEYGILLTKNGTKVKEIGIGSKDNLGLTDEETHEESHLSLGELADGRYEIIPISRETGKDTWIPCDNSEYKALKAWAYGDWLSIKSSVNDGTNFDIISCEQTDETPLRVGQEAHYELKVRNSVSPKFYDGAVLAKIVWNENGAEKDSVVYINRLTCVAGETTTMNFSFTPFVSGEQQLVILNKYWSPVGSTTISPVGENESLNMLEMTNLRIDDYDEDRHILDATILNGAITLFNHDVVTHSRLVYISFTEVETQKVKERPLIVSIPPNEQITYNFKFSDLKEGNHYEIVAKYYLGGEIYHSGTFLCTNDASHDENIAGNEHLRSFEYWFDDDYEHRSTISLNTQKASVRAALETDHLDDGFHFLHFRVQRDDDSYSGISRSPFLKLSKKEEGYLEYWIDEDEDNKQRLPLDDTEEEQLLTLDLCDNELYPVGFHRLHYQVAVPGSIVGSVQTQAILKLPLGKVTKLEYWFDNNRNAVYEINVNGTESGSWLFANNLNLTGLAPGHHRLYYRAKGADKQLTSAVGMAAIVVNSQFRAEYGDAVLSSFSLSVDGATVVEQGKLNNQKEQEFTYTLDASQLAVGTHTLRASFWNSYGVSVTEQVPFRVSKLGYMKGDVNADGEVDVADAVCIVNHIIGKFVPIFIEPAADVNNDNEIDIADAVCIVNYIIGKIPQFSSYSTFAQPMRSVLPKELLEALPEPQ